MIPFSRWRANILCAASLALAPLPARAQDPAGAAWPREPGVAPGTNLSEDVPAALALPAGLPADDARNFARAGRHAEAAQRLLGAFQATADARFLYHAGRERVAAGQNTLALDCFKRALAQLGADGALRAHLERLIALAQSRTTPVRLRIVDRRTQQSLPPDVLARTKITARGSTPTAAVPAELARTGDDGEPLWLDPGPWSVQVHPPGYRPVELRRGPLWGAGEETWDVAVVPEQVPVTLRVSPARALRRATLRLTPSGGSAPIERPIERGEETVVLTGGPWQLDITAKRHEAHASFVAASPMQPVDVRLQRKRSQRGSGSSRDSGRMREFERDDKLMAGIGVAFIAQLAVGAGLALAGGIKRQRAGHRNEALLQDALVEDATGDADGQPGLEQVEAAYPTAHYHRDIGRALNLETAGVTLTMSGAAALIPALTVALRASRRAGFIELGVGAALLGGGAAWLATALRERNARLAEDDPTGRVRQLDLRPLAAHNFGASLLTGVGAGLTLFSMVALANDARVSRRNRRSMGAAPLAAPGLAGVLLRGRF